MAVGVAGVDAAPGAALVGLAVAVLVAGVTGAELDALVLDPLERGVGGVPLEEKAIVAGVELALVEEEEGELFVDW